MVVFRMNLCIFIVSKNGEALSGYYKQSQKYFTVCPKT
ncbi:hypothetical protein LEP1GSC161_3890 [Leptospira santarosai str. CBC1416]|uniref:Uncharacterized protein n=1 Tax=Leptospira santarosai str. CBC1416 TaxID=1193059 RepID=M6VZW3_9LEPT|nr:hypothetical protein LEP1GSC161_3890 [Leptospira santarosai str. CBC1416]